MESLYQQLIALPHWLIVVATIALSTLIMLLAKRVLLRRITRLTDRSRYRFDSLLAQALNLPLTIGILVINLVILHRMLEGMDIAGPRSGELLSLSGKILLILAILLFVDRLINATLSSYSGRSELLRSSNGIIKGVSRALILGIGLLIILGTLGISITPLIASLGITSLAVALALQPTLENFFSGVQLVVDKPFRVDDFIELDSGEQGYVEKIGWRSTWIRMLPNNLVIMPNSLMSNSKVINYCYPSKELSVLVELGVHYDSDLEHVEQVITEVANNLLQEHEFGVNDFDPLVVWHTFDNSSINCTVILRAHEFVQRFLLKSAFIKAIYRRFNQEGIVIPYPIRAINLDQEGVDLTARLSRAS